MESINSEGIDIALQKSHLDFCGPAPEAKLVNTIWIFKIKYGEYDKIITYKSLYARSYKQIKGRNYQETLVPVVR